MAPPTREAEPGLPPPLPADEVLPRPVDGGGSRVLPSPPELKGRFTGQPMCGQPKMRRSLKEENKVF